MDDIPKIGITGMPKVGKTRSLLKIIEFLETAGYQLEGMVTEPIMKKNERVRLTKKRFLPTSTLM